MPFGIGPDAIVKFMIMNGWVRGIDQGIVDDHVMKYVKNESMRNSPIENVQL